ncbi:MAG: hypothetical protein H0T53_01150 [Herpetosiphonaceae bacterium]|nr:hypothetical protein [Herpetosiphonaceae bacterium]
MKKLLLIVVILLGLSGCGRALAGTQAAPSSGIRVWLDQPLDGSSQPVGPTLLKAHARSEIGGGINRIMFVVNGTEIGSVATDATAPLVAAELNWSPTVLGEYIVQAQAFSGDRSTISAAARVCVGAQITAALSDGTCGLPQPTAASVALATVRPAPTAISTATPSPSPSATTSASPTTPPATATAAPQLPSATPRPLAPTVVPTLAPTVVVPSATPTQRSAPTFTATPTATQPSLTPVPPSTTPTLVRDTAPPVLVGSIDTTPLVTYYGPCQQDEPGILSVSLVASDASGIGAATLSYTFLSSRGGALGGAAVTMAQAPVEGGTLLSAAVNVARDAPQYLGSNNGLITYRLDVSDTLDNATQIQGANFEVRACQLPPTATPTLVPRDTTPPTFGRVYASPNEVFYGTCSGQPSRTSLIAEVSDPSGIGSVTVRYRFRSEVSRIPPGAWTTLTLSGGQDVYSAVVNVGGEAYATLQGTNGFLDYEFSASDSVGNSTQSSVLAASVFYCIG